MNIAGEQHLIGKMFGSYVLQRLLGYGGTSAVYLAQDSKSEQKVAVKVFRLRDGLSRRAQRDFYRRFLHEAEAASKLDHPHILPIYAYGEENGLPYIVMPYMEGGTLLDYMSKRGSLSLHETQWYLKQLASALDYAHEHGCVHCDVKPANMLLDREGRVMLSDFGIAYLMNNTNNATRSPDSAMGTPDYVSPEQALGQGLDGCSDIYSLGVTLFFLLAKKLPFKADTPIATALLQIHEPPPSLSLLRADVSPALDRVIQKALAKDPARRFPTAYAFHDAFVSALTHGYEKSSLASVREVSSFDHELSDEFFDSLPDLPIAQPVVRLLPLRTNHALLLHPALLMLVCLLVLSFAGTTIALMVSHTPQKEKVVVGVTPTPSPKPRDKLADDKQWLSTNPFFFDSQSQSYHLLNASSDAVAIASYLGDEYSDFRLTAVASEIRHVPGKKGYYGITFRESLDHLHYYLFEISANDEGTYFFRRYDNGWTTLSQGSLGTMLKSDAPNTLTIEARGNTFTFWVNETLVGQPYLDKGSPMVRGRVGLYAEDPGTEVAFYQVYVDP